MTVAEICVSAYLITGGVAAALIWSVLKASKRHQHKARNENYGQLDSKLFREGNTKPSRFHL